MGKKQQKQNQNRAEAPQNFEVFISGLPYETTQEQIKTFFDFATDPIIKLPKYQDTGRCLGYGHVEFSTQEQFEQALKKDRQHIGPRYVNIQPAKGQKPVQEPEKKTVPVGCKVLFIKNLPYAISEQQLNKEFSTCGVVKDVRMIRNWQTKKFKGFVYIDYKDNGSVKKAIAKYHGKPFRGRNLICDAVTTQMKKGFKKHLKPEDNQQGEQQEMNEEVENEENEE